MHYTTCKLTKTRNRKRRTNTELINANTLMLQAGGQHSPHSPDPDFCGFFRHTLYAQGRHKVEKIKNWPDVVLFAAHAVAVYQKDPKNPPIVSTQEDLIPKRGCGFLSNDFAARYKAVCCQLIKTHGEALEGLLRDVVSDWGPVAKFLDLYTVNRSYAEVFPFHLLTYFRYKDPIDLFRNLGMPQREDWRFLHPEHKPGDSLHKQTWPEFYTNGHDMPLGLRKDQGESNKRRGDYARLFAL